MTSSPATISRKQKGCLRAPVLVARNQQQAETRKLKAELEKERKAELEKERKAETKRLATPNQPLRLAIRQMKIEPRQPVATKVPTSRLRSSRKRSYPTTTR